MHIQEERHGEVQIVMIDDHLDTSTASTFEEKLFQLIDGGRRRILVDCTPLQYVNSAGLKVLLLATRRLETDGGQLVLCALSPNVMNILKMIGFTQILKIVATRDEALQALCGAPS